jgi:hypothetical protein
MAKLQSAHLVGHVELNMSFGEWRVTPLDWRGKVTLVLDDYARGPGESGYSVYIDLSPSQAGRLATELWQAAMKSSPSDAGTESSSVDAPVTIDDEPRL